MLTLSYLQQIIQGELQAVTDLEKQVIESAAGYDGIIALIQTKGVSPLIVLENSEIGEFSVRPGGFEKTSQSIWVMKMVGRDDDRRAIQDECRAMMKRIISVLVNQYAMHKPELSQWDCESIPWGARNAGANFTGYEFTLYFSEDTDLSYHG